MNEFLEESSEDLQEETFEEFQEETSEISSSIVYDSAFTQSDVQYIKSGVGIIAIVLVSFFFTYVSILVFRWLSKLIG